MVSSAPHPEIRAAFQAAQTVLIVSHIRPDGDATGALLGLGLALENVGKQVQMVLVDGVPPCCRHLEGAKRIRHKAQGSFDLVVSVDISDLKRTGTALDDHRAPDLVIDHHVTNDGFGGINLIWPEYAATSEILAECLPLWGLEITPAIANALLMGILTDTLGFRTSSTRPRTLRLAADLVQGGADLPLQYGYGLLRRSYSAAAYWGAGLGKLERDDHMVWATLTLADRQATHYPGSDDADLVSFLSGLDGFDVALLFIEQHGGRTKVSWRSVPGLDVSALAQSFGGGGHPAASGADIPGTLADVQRDVLAATRALLVEMRGSSTPLKTAAELK